MSVDTQPTVCNLCGGQVIYTTNDTVYGRTYGSGFCYVCTNCHAYVGTHIPRPKEALGLLADEQMRKGKIMCHDLFDQMWKGKPHQGRERQNAYHWLAAEMGIPVNECHFGYFTLDQLRTAYRILKNKTEGIDND